MLGFSQLSKPLKWQNLIEKGKNSRDAFRTGAKIHFRKKKYFGVMGTLQLYYIEREICLYSPSFTLWLIINNIRTVVGCLCRIIGEFFGTRTFSYLIRNE